MKFGNRAQTGVGSLILFISMILVASVAASVLLQTSSGLQQQASKTGEQAIKEVSNKVKTMSVVGYSLTPSSSNVDKLLIAITPNAGSGEIKFSDIIFNYQSENVYLAGVYYNSSASDDNDQADFSISVAKGDSDEVLSHGEIVELAFWIEDSTSHPLGTNTEFIIDIHIKGGGTTKISGISPTLYKNAYTSIM